MSKAKSKAKQPVVHVDGEVLRQIRQHARLSNKTEVCGVLIGSEDENSLAIEARIPGINAAQAGTHVTFTQDTWEHIYKIKDREYPTHRIVGWYHSHPGFGVFLSDHDTFIHKNFFSSPLQVAWVYDPHSDEEGCFGWIGNRLERLSEIAISDHRGGEGAGETGKPEPMGAAEGSGWIDQGSAEPDDESPVWLRVSVSVLSYAMALAIGFCISWMLFPRQIPVPLIYDQITGRVYDPKSGREVEMPPGTRVTPDGRLEIPGINTSPIDAGPKPSLNDNGPKPDAGDRKNPAPSGGSGKEKNVPKQ
jgi:proteasome lid subunit RPN8/RPN11